VTFWWRFTNGKFPGSSTVSFWGRYNGPPVLQCHLSTLLLRSLCSYTLSPREKNNANICPQQTKPEFCQIIEDLQGRESTSLNLLDLCLKKPRKWLRFVIWKSGKGNVALNYCLTAWSCQAWRRRAARALSGPRFKERSHQQRLLTEGHFQGRGDERDPTVLLLVGKAWNRLCRSEETSGLAHDILMME